MKKILFILVLISLSLPLFAEITISSVQGLVEIMLPGSGSWESAAVGTTLPPSSRISTGFNSNALLLINNTSEVTVKPLTRLKVEEVIGQSGSGDQQTKLFMNTGRINANVKKNEGNIHDFQIRTPVSTAAVRGTRFSFSPGKLKVEEGTVQYSVGKYSFALGRGQSITMVMANGQPVLMSPVQSILNDRRVRTNTGSETDSESETEDSTTENQSGKTGYAAIHLK